jgi:hypothetical protein
VRTDDGLRLVGVTPRALSFAVEGPCFNLPDVNDAHCHVDRGLLATRHRGHAVRPELPELRQHYWHFYACQRADPMKPSPGWMHFRRVSIPAIATVLESVALLYLIPSVWQIFS